MTFFNRRDAGRRLALRLAEGAPGPIRVVAVGEGGAALAYEVARVRGAPLEVIAVAAVAAPDRAHAPLGAVAEGANAWLDAERCARAGLPEAELAARVAQAARAARDRAEALHGAHPLVLAGQTLLLVCDGLWTGAHARAAVASVRGHRPRAVLLAAAVGTEDAIRGVGRALGRAPVVLAIAGGPVAAHFQQDLVASDREIRAWLSRCRGGPGEARGWARREVA